MLLGTRTNKSLLCADRIQACNVDHEHKRRYRGISPNQVLLVGPLQKASLPRDIKGDLFSEIVVYSLQGQGMRKCSKTLMPQPPSAARERSGFRGLGVSVLGLGFGIWMSCGHGLATLGSFPCQIKVDCPPPQTLGLTPHHCTLVLITAKGPLVLGNLNLGNLRKPLG